jgi:hypothetical protein
VRTEFEIIYGRLIEIGNELKELPIDRHFLNKTKIYQNFFNQLMQILNKDRHLALEKKDDLIVLEQMNVVIEKRLIDEKNKIKSEINKTNLKEKLKKHYN